MLGEHVINMTIFQLKVAKWEAKNTALPIFFFFCKYTYFLVCLLKGQQAKELIPRKI